MNDRRAREIFREVCAGYEGEMHEGPEGMLWFKEDSVWADRRNICLGHSEPGSFRNRYGDLSVWDEYWYFQYNCFSANGRSGFSLVCKTEDELMKGLVSSLEDAGFRKLDRRISLTGEREKTEKKQKMPSKARKARGKAFEQGEQLTLF